MARSHECFFGENRSYHEARTLFVHKTGAPCKVAFPAAPARSEAPALTEAQRAVTKVRQAKSAVAR